MADSIFMGQGKVFVAPLGPTGIIGGFNYIGDTNMLSLKNSQEFDDVLESTSGNRAVKAHIPTKTTTNLDMTMQEWSMSNLIRSLNGTSAGSVASGTVTAEPLSVYASSIGFTEHQNISTLVLTKASTPLVEGTDYTVDLVMGMITFLPASTVITGPGANAITASYAYAASAGKIQAMMFSAKTFYVKFVGINVADGGSSVAVDMFRVSLNLPADLGFIDAKHSDLVINGMLLEDSTRPAGTSKFYTIQKQSV